MITIIYSLDWLFCQYSPKKKCLIAKIEITNKLKNVYLMK